MEQMIVESAERLFAQLREQESADRSAQNFCTSAWQTAQESGFLDALLPESAGGAGLRLSDVFPLALAAGRHGVDLPFMQTMLARAQRHAAGQPLPQEPVFSVDDAEIDAAIDCALMAGAMEQVLSLTMTYVNQREQFGKPIGRFQAVQQQISIMAEQVWAARMAAQLAFQSASWMPRPMLAALGKARASTAAVLVSDIAHAMHGAIGITEEYALQHYTRRIRTWRRTHGTENYWNQRIGQHALHSPAPSALVYLRENLA